MSGNREELDEGPGRGGGSRQARERLQEQTDEEIPEDAIETERTRDGFEASISEDFQRRRARERLQQRTDAEIPDSQFTYDETDEGITAGVSEEFQRNQVKQQVREETGFDLADDEIIVERVNGRYQARVAEEAQREQAIRALQEQTEEDIPEGAIDVMETDEGFQAGVSDEFQRDQARRALLEEIGPDVPEEDFVFEVGGSTVQRTGDRGLQRAQALSEVLDQTEVNLDKEDVSFERSRGQLRVSIADSARQDALEEAVREITGEEVDLDGRPRNQSATTASGEPDDGGPAGGFFERGEDALPDRFEEGPRGEIRDRLGDAAGSSQAETGDGGDGSEPAETPEIAELTADEIVVEETGDGFQARLSEDFQRSQVREQIQESTDAQIPEEDIIVGPGSDGGFRGTVDEDFQREQLRQDIQQATDAQVPEEDIQITETADGFEASVAEEFQRDLLRGQLQEQTDFQVPDSAIQISETDDGLEASISEGFQRERLREQLQEGTDFQIPEEDIIIEETRDGLEASISEGFQRERLREQIQDQTDFQVPESAIEIDEDTSVDEFLGDIQEGDINQGALGDIADRLLTGDELDSTLSASIDEGFQRERVREQIQEQTDEQLPADAIEVRDTEDGIVGSVSEDYQRTQIRESIQESTDEEIPESAIEVFEVEDLRDVTDQYRAGEIDSDQLQEAIETGKQYGFTGGLAGRVSDEYQREQAREQLLSEVDPETDVDLTGEDVVVEETDEGFQARLSEDTLDEVETEQRQATREEVANQLGVPAAAVSPRFGDEIAGQYGVRPDWAAEVGLGEVDETQRSETEVTSGFADAVRQDIDSGQVDAPTIQGGFAESVADQFEQPTQQRDVGRAISRVGGVTESERQFTQELDQAEAEAAAEIEQQVRQAQAEQIGLSGTESLDADVTAQLADASDVTAGDVDPVQTDEGVQFELADEQREQIVAGQASLATGVALEGGEDVRAVESGATIQGVEGTTIREGETFVDLTESGRQAIRERRTTTESDGFVSSGIDELTSGGEGIASPTEQEAQRIAESDSRINIPDTPEEGVSISDLPGADRITDAAGRGVSATVAAGDAVLTPVAEASARAGTTLENRVVEPVAGILASGLEDLPATTAGTEVVGGRDAGTFTEPGTEGGRQARTALETVGKAPTTLIGAGDTERLANRSSDATEAVTETVVEPGAGIVGSGLEDLPATTAGTEVVGGRDAGTFTEPGTQGGRIAERFTEGAGSEVASLTVGAPALAVGAGSASKDVGAFVGEEFTEEGVVGGAGAVASAGGSAAVTAGDRAVRAARESPARFAGTIAGGTAVGSALSPVRFGRVSLPAEAGGEISVRGLRLAEPRILRGRVDTPGRTIAGTVDGSPRLGTPRVDSDRIDFSRLEGRGGTTEAVGRFETDVFREVARDAGPDAAERFEAAESLAAQGSRVDTNLEIDEAEDIVRQAELIPDEDAPDVADALLDVDATLFGSAAIRSQIPEARTPKDLDIAVDNPGQATAQLSERLADTDVDIDAFDIKSRSEKASPGEVVKLGRIAQPRLRTEEGLRVTPASEELIKKSGASAFVRGESAPSPGSPGRRGEVDVGPEPGAKLRVKDPADASAIAGSLANVDGFGPISPLARRRARQDIGDVEDFRDAFEPEIREKGTPQPEIDGPTDLITRQRLAEFAEADRAQLSLFGGGRATRSADTDVSRDVGGGRRTSPSPSAGSGFGRTAPVPLVSSPLASSPDDVSGFSAPAIDEPSISSPSSVADVAESPAASRVSSGGTASPPSSPGVTEPGSTLRSPGDDLSPGSPVVPDTTSEVTGVSEISRITASDVGVSSDTTIGTDIGTSPIQAQDSTETFGIPSPTAGTSSTTSATTGGAFGTGASTDVSFSVAETLDITTTTSSTGSAPLPDPDEDFQLLERDVTARQRRQVRELPDPSQDFVPNVATDPSKNYGLPEDER